MEWNVVIGMYWLYIVKTRFYMIIDLEQFNSKPPKFAYSKCVMQHTIKLAKRPLKEVKYRWKYSNIKGFVQNPGNFCEILGILSSILGNF